MEISLSYNMETGLVEGRRTEDDHAGNLVLSASRLMIWSALREAGFVWVGHPRVPALKWWHRPDDQADSSGGSTTESLPLSGTTEPEEGG